MKKTKSQPPALVPPDAACGPIPGYSGYFINLAGAVYSKAKKLQPTLAPGKGARVKPKGAHGKMVRVTVAKLLALTFIPNPEGYRHLIFKNRDKSNCAVENIAWVSLSAFRSHYHSSSLAAGLLGAVRRKKDLPLPCPVDPARVPVKGHPGYFIAPQGIVYRGSRILALNRRKRKALQVRIAVPHTAPRTYKSYGVATLVANHFVPNPGGTGISFLKTATTTTATATILRGWTAKPLCGIAGCCKSRAGAER